MFYVTALRARRKYSWGVSEGSRYPYVLWSEFNLGMPCGKSKKNKVTEYTDVVNFLLMFILSVLGDLCVFYGLVRIKIV